MVAEALSVVVTRTMLPEGDRGHKPGCRSVSEVRGGKGRIWGEISPGKDKAPESQVSLVECLPGCHEGAGKSDRRHYRSEDLVFGCGQA